VPRSLPLPFQELRDALAARPARLLGPPTPDVHLAAVLAPLFMKDEEPQVLFIKRPEGDYSHAGQIAFPGGRKKDSDADSLATAFREAEEEVGIRGSDVELLGRLNEYDTVVSGFRVSPYVGLLDFPYPFRSDAREVSFLIEMPIRTLLDPSIFREQPYTRGGVTWPVYFYSAGDHVVWGATGAMIHELLGIVRELPSWERYAK
jgi:8-oxo-dGTP pyrophosphatase MutT (NUDIX family)